MSLSGIILGVINIAIRAARDGAQAVHRGGWR
jgi:hypothetical protein